MVACPQSVDDTRASGISYFVIFASLILFSYSLGLRTWAWAGLGWEKTKRICDTKSGKVNANRTRRIEGLEKGVEFPPKRMVGVILLGVRVFGTRALDFVEVVQKDILV